MSIPANHVGTVNESKRICEHFRHFIPNYCTFFVATISTPVPAASASSTSPIFTGACAVTCRSAATISKILPFGISCAVLQLTTAAPVVLPVRRTVLVTMRVGFVTSFLA